MRAAVGGYFDRPLLDPRTAEALLLMRQRKRARACEFELNSALCTLRRSGWDRLRARGAQWGVFRGRLSSVLMKGDHYHSFRALRLGYPGAGAANHKVNSR
jgi:hypothetical protein